MGQQRIGELEVVGVLLHDGGDRPAHAEAVTAHDHGDIPAILIEHPGGHCLAVLGAQLEYVSHLDTALDLQGALAVGAGVPFFHPAQVLYPAGRAVRIPVAGDLAGANPVELPGGRAHQAGARIGGSFDRRSPRSSHRSRLSI